MTRNNAFEFDVLILGGGFAGVYCAKELRRALRKKSRLRVGLVANKNHMIFQPMLPEVAGGAIAPDHVINPLRLLCPGTEILQADIKKIDLPGRRVVVNTGPFTGNHSIGFHDLVLALGAETDVSVIPGMPEHGYLLKNVADAIRLRSSIIQRIEEANIETRPEIRRRLLTFVVVGGGYSGVESAGHILDLFRAVHTFYDNVSYEDFQVVLIHGREHLLPTLHRQLGEYSARQLTSRGLKVILNHRVQSVTANRVVLDNGEAIEANTVICTVGNTPNPLVAQCCEENQLPSASGQVKVNACGQVPGHEGLWGAGDCAYFMHPDDHESCPNTAQFALRQGRIIGRNIALRRQQKPPEPLRFKGYGEMASIGHRHAVGEIMGVRFKGMFAWWLWRTVYLLKLPRLDRKIRVVFDWTLDLFFPRDIALIHPRYTISQKHTFLDKGDHLFNRGDPAFSLHLVKSGSIALVRDGQVIRTVTPDDGLLDDSFLEDGVWTVDAVGTQPTRVFSIPMETYGEIAKFIKRPATPINKTIPLEESKTE